MQIFSRVTKAFAALATLFIAFLVTAPAHAHGDLDTLEPFNRAGEGVNWVAITIVMVVLLAVILGIAQLVSNAFKK